MCLLLPSVVAIEETASSIDRKPKCTINDMTGPHSEQRILKLLGAKAKFGNIRSTAICTGSDELHIQSNLPVKLVTHLPTLAMVTSSVMET